MLAAELHKLQTGFFEGSVRLDVELGGLRVLALLKKLISPDSRQVQPLLLRLGEPKRIFDVVSGQKLAPCVDFFVFEG